jgi:hypothetical protein
MIRHMSFLALAGLVISDACQSAAAKTAPPNMTVLVTDDQAYGDMSCHDNPVFRLYAGPA